MIIVDYDVVMEDIYILIRLNWCVDIEIKNKVVILRNGDMVIIIYIGA